ncbi:MAG: hypothetical protein R3B71_01730 [Candidatus Gracilibacteria bacterium]
MIFRRVLAAFLVFVFIAVSAAAFMVFAVSNTFLRASFYEEDLRDPAYDFLVSTTVSSIEESNGPIGKYFLEEELQEEVEGVFPKELFDKTVREVIEEVETLKDDPEQPLTFKLNTYRESLLTLAHNLAFRMFQTLPTCGEGELPRENSDGLPSCVPSGIEYGDIADDLSMQFEKDIYAAVPEQGQFDIVSAFGEAGLGVFSVLVQLDSIRAAFYGILLVLLALIALLIYKPFTRVLMQEGLAFTLSGLVGLIVGFAITLFVPMIMEQRLGDLYTPSLNNLMSHMMGLFSGEVYKAGAIFLITGVILLVVRHIMKNR